MLIFSLLNQPILFVLWIIAVVVSITLHEFSHALAGKLQGDHTAEQAGRLTLNPLAHIDWLGFMLLVIAGFGWAKPTPFNPYNLRFRRIGPSLIAAAGPLSNALIVIVIGFALRLLIMNVGIASDNLLMLFFILLIQVNVLLGVFNLIPIPPLDGSKILLSVLIVRAPRFAMMLEQYGTFLLLALIFFGSEYISLLYSYFFNLTMTWIF